MLKKLIIGLFTVLVLAGITFANVVPVNTSDIPNTTIGVYQADKNLVIYSKPDKKSEVILERPIDYPKLIGLKNDSMFAVLVPEKELGYLYVTDTSDDEEWVQVIYDKTKGLKGWVQKNDDFQFMPWVNFYNLYGRKYGLALLKPESPVITGIFSNPDDNAQVLGQLSRPKFIHLTSVEGVWMLVSVLDLMGNTTTGYIRWRDVDGNIFIFPCMK